MSRSSLMEGNSHLTVAVRLVRHNGSIIRAWHPCGMASKNLEMYGTFALSSTPSLRWHGPLVQTARQSFSIKCWLDYTGRSAKQALDWEWEVATHPDEL